MKVQVIVTAYDPGVTPKGNYPRLIMQEQIGPDAFAQPLQMDCPTEYREPAFKPESLVNETVDLVINNLSQATFGGLVQIRVKGRIIRHPKAGK